MKTFILMVTSMLVIVSCAHRNGDPIANAKTAADERDLQEKNFTSICTAKPVEAIFTAIVTAFSTSVQSATTTYRFEGANVTRTTRFFTLPGCSGDTAVMFKETGDFNLHKDQKTSDGGKAIDIDFSTLQVTTVTAAGVEAANAIPLCSANDWSINSQRDETAHSAEVKCLGTPYPHHEANVYRVDANVLYLGSTSNKPSDPTQRPTALDAGVKYTAQ